MRMNSSFYITLFLILLLYRSGKSVDFVSTSSRWRLPVVKELFMVGDQATLYHTVQGILSRNRTIVATVSKNVDADLYLALHFGRIMNLFEDTLYNSSFIVFQKPLQLTWVETILLMLSHMPPKSIFLSYQHGPSGVGMPPVIDAKRIFGYSPAVVFHMNHERPWVTAEDLQGDPQKFRIDFTYNITQELADAYEEFPVVFRHYYYAPLLSSAQYIPIQAPFYGHLIDNPENPYYALFESLRTTPVSQRAVLCLFRGRLTYANNYLKKEYMKEGSASFQIDDRARLIYYHAEGGLKKCKMEEVNTELEASKNFVQLYEEYMMQLAQAGFVLCPMGNNPETFRFYEALEAGAIPLITLPPWKERNFLRCKFILCVFL
jgi:hypothetical protein